MKFFAIVGLLLGVNAFQNNGHANLPLPSHGAKIETENPPYTPDGVELYQGDMILTEEQREWLESPPGMRKATNEREYLWPRAEVQFTISPSSVNDRQAILRAMQHWTQNSCVTFEEVLANHSAPHLIFEKRGGCYSSLGRLYYKNGQIISIGDGCETMGTITHEIGHALGFHHEQSRPDRDDFVVILNQNLNQMKARNYKTEPNADTFGVPYDVGSIMHYGPDGFSINGRNTLVTRDPFEHFVIGQREALSFADLKLAHLLYNCASRCPANNCLNDGYLDQSCQCKCPPGYSGNYCQNGASVENALTCGGSVNSATTISSPSYPHRVAAGTKCVWIVTAPADRKVRAIFNDFQISPRLEGYNECFLDFLELRTNDLYDGEKFCDKELKGYTVSSRGNTMVLVFSTESSTYPGFNTSITFV